MCVRTQAQRCLLKVFQTLVALVPDNKVLKEGSPEVRVHMDHDVIAMNACENKYQLCLMLAVLHYLKDYK